MRLTKDFILQEFVPKEIFEQFGERSLMFIDPMLPALVQAIRNAFGVPVTLNTWHIGGTRNECGYRVPNTTTGAKYSQHKFGRAADLHCADLSVKEMFDIVNNNFKGLSFLGLTTIENINSTPTWLHIDTRWTGLIAPTELNIVNP